MRTAGTRVIGTPNAWPGPFTQGERTVVGSKYSGGETNNCEHTGEGRCYMTSRDNSHDRGRDRDRDPVPLSQRLLLRPEEVAGILGLGRSTIYELLRTGELSAVHIGRATRIPARDLHQWIDQHNSVKDTTDAGDSRHSAP